MSLPKTNLSLGLIQAIWKFTIGGHCGIGGNGKKSKECGYNIIVQVCASC